MKKKMAGVLLISSVMVSTAFAGVADDLNNGLSLDVVLQNAVDAGGTIQSATFEIVKLVPERAGNIVAMAVAACENSAVQSAVSSGAVAACERSVAQSAISAGADPAVVTAATAAPRFGSRPAGMTRQQLRDARRAKRVAERRLRPSERTTPLASYY